MPELVSQGLGVSLPSGWDGHIYRRGAAGPAQTHPVLHAATFALPPERGDFGGGAVELMGADDIFVSLFDFGPDAASAALYQKRSGVPRSVSADMFSPHSLQRGLPGQCGLQVFFNAGGRGLCLYIVLGSWQDRVSLVAKVNQLLPTLRVAS